jgi:hypothetical protein
MDKSRKEHATVATSGMRGVSGSEVAGERCRGRQSVFARIGVEEGAHP